MGQFMILPISGYSQKSINTNGANRVKPAFVASGDKPREKHKTPILVDVLVAGGFLALVEYFGNLLSEHKFSKDLDKIDLGNIELEEVDMDKLLRDAKRAEPKKIMKFAKNSITRKRI